MVSEIILVGKLVVYALDEIIVVHVHLQHDFRVASL